MPGSGEIFLSQVREARTLDVGVLETSRYFEPQMPTTEANTVAWSEFKDRIKPIGIIDLEASGLECLVVPKTVPWGSEDLTIFVGKEHRKLEEIDSLSSREGENFLGLNFYIADGLINSGHSNQVQISIGFNPQDLSLGHHTVLKLHSHVRAINKSDIAQRRQFSWDSMDRFSKMSFIEPFSPLYHDYIKRAIQSGLLGDFLIDTPTANLGYTSLHLRRDRELPRIFDGLKALYMGMKSEYASIADIFTSGLVDPPSGRLIPRLKEERILRLEQFLESRGEFYSPQSIKILRYLAEHIQSARPRDPQNPNDMSSMAMMYLSMGFAGGLTFAFENDKESVRSDFMPRVITTSAVTKTMLGQDLPTRIDKTKIPATRENQEVARLYYERVLGIIEDERIISRPGS